MTYASPIEGKRQNCGSFGTFEPADSDATSATLCHGGDCLGRTYEPCAVMRECKLATIRKKLKRAEDADPEAILNLLANADNDDEPEEEDDEDEEEEDMDEETEKELLGGGFRRHRVNAPDWGNLETKIPMAERDASGGEVEAPQREAPRPRHTYAEQARAMSEPPVVLVNEGCVGPSQFGRVVLPNPGSLRGLRTPFVAPSEHYGGEIVPTYLPDESENTWERMGKNMAQGMLAAAGWVLYNYCRNVDLFK